MTSTKTNMMNADLENGFSFPSTVSKPPHTYDTKVPLPTTSDDLQKPSSWCSSKRPVVIAVLFLAALLLGMIIATVVIFSLEMHRDRAVLVQEGRHNSTGGHHHRHHHRKNKTTTSHAEDGDDAKPDTRNWWQWWYSSSSQWESSSVWWSSEWSSESSPWGSSSTYHESSESSWAPWGSSSYESSSPSESSWSPWGPSSSDSSYESPYPESSESSYESESSESSSSSSTPDNQDNPDEPATDAWTQLQGKCGRSSVSPDSRIVNGDAVTDRGVWPWAGYLSYKTGSFFCGAELISPQWAVTAAHCVEGTSANQIEITLGTLELTGSGGVTRSIAAIKRHPNYDSDATNNDIALLRLSTPIPSDHNTIKPVCITSEDNEIDTFETTTVSGVTRHACYVVGWGATSQGGSVSNTLLQVESPISNRAECNQAYRSYGGITDSMICTSTTPESGANPSGSCQGDSGGPMMCRKPKANANDADVWELVGVTSFGIGCADQHFPDVLARVSEFYDWIRTCIQNNL